MFRLAAAKGGEHCAFKIAADTRGQFKMCWMYPALLRKYAGFFLEKCPNKRNVSVVPALEKVPD